MHGTPYFYITARRSAGNANQLVSISSLCIPPGVLPDLKSGIKKYPNLLMLCGFGIRSKGVCLSFYWGITNPPVLIGRTFFYGGLQIRRDA